MTPDTSIAAYAVTLAAPFAVFGIVLAFFHYVRKLRAFLRDYNPFVDGEAR
jgi:hypothetical protein